MIFAFCIIAIGKVNAAELFFETKSQEFTQGEKFLANIFLNTEEESINAIEGKIVFPDYLLEVKEIQDGNSIINFWIERPKIGQIGVIAFSGIIPGGYQETKGFLFSVVFQTKASGSGAIEVRGAKVLLNDGKGTEASVKLSSFQFSISQEIPFVPLTVETIKDTDPPEDFKPEIAQNFGMFEGKYFLVFATQDKGSGIDRYEIQETRNKRQGENWAEAESPYVLKDQNLRSYIYVKAVDKAGNERIVIVEPKYLLKWYENWWIWGIIILGVFVLYISRKILWRKFIKSR